MNYPLLAALFMALAGAVGIVVGSYRGTGVMFFLAGLVGAALAYRRGQ